MERDEMDRLVTELANQNPQEVIAYFLEKYAGRIAFATSLGAEDQVLTEMMSGLRPLPHIFTLDTGRLFPETYDLLEKTTLRYKLRIKMYFPDRHDVEEMVAEKGINLFYGSPENRKLCCNIRKVRPLKRALEGMEAWICGLRKEQSAVRGNDRLVEWDSNYNLLKINPLIEWTQEQVWEYIRKRDIPYNPLHDKGFASIGCQPCTRAVMPGEDPRAGRWWWEAGSKKECGLHDISNPG